MKTEFKPEDFLNQGFGFSLASVKRLTDLANNILPEIKEAWKAEMLKDATVVYNNANSPKYNWSPTLIHDDTHKALLINIEPIVKECVKHEPCKHTPYYKGVPDQKNIESLCIHCGVELIPEWKEKK